MENYKRHSNKKSVKMQRDMYVKVKVTPEAKRESITRVSKDHYEIAVKEPAERNMANKRVRELVARHFKVPIGKVRLISGHHSPSKIFSIEDAPDLV